MPELPEVEVVRAGLAPAVAGAVVEQVSVFDERALTRHRGSAVDFEARLGGKTLRAPARRGKFLWIPVEAPGGPNEAVIAHLGMSGQLLLRPSGAPPERHERIRFDIAHPVHGAIAVVFADQRTFGSLAIDPLVTTADGLPAGVEMPEPLIPAQVWHIARDPLDHAFDARAFRHALRTKTSTIKRVLLDQTTVSGVGNIYADEALWAARLHPDRRAADLSTRAVNRLVDEVRVVMLKALAEGGTSFDAQYVNVNGQAGYFARALNVYGKAGQPCPRCGRPIVKVAFTNRSSHFCPGCQRP